MKWLTYKRLSIMDFVVIEFIIMVVKIVLHAKNITLF